MFTGLGIVVGMLLICITDYFSNRKRNKLIAEYSGLLIDYIRQIRNGMANITHELEGIKGELNNTNLDAPRFHEKLNAMNVPKLSDDGDVLSPFERLCLWCREVDRVRSGKKYSWDENETAANRGEKK